MRMCPRPDREGLPCIDGTKPTRELDRAAFGSGPIVVASGQFGVVQVTDVRVWRVVAFGHAQPRLVALKVTLAVTRLDQGGQLLDRHLARLRRRPATFKGELAG